MKPTDAKATKMEPGSTGLKDATKSQRHQFGTSRDLEFKWVTSLDPDLDDWRSLAARWMMTHKTNIAARLFAIGKFLMYYIHPKGYSDPESFLRRNLDCQPPPLIDLVARNPKTKV